MLATGVRTLGSDTFNPDQTVLDGSGDHAVHHVVLGAGGVIAENLKNLAAIDGDDVVVSLLPLRLGGADGAPVRAAAMQLP